MKTILTKELWQYSIDYGSKPLPQILNFITTINKNLINGNMQAGVDVCLFMGFIANAIKASSYLEVGIFTGYSLISMLTYLPANSIVTALELNKKHIEIVQSLIQYANNIAINDYNQPKIEQNIEYIQQNANISMKNLITENRKYDLIFIDANKSCYLNYYQYAKKLLTQNGILMIDNVFKGHYNIQEQKKRPNFIEKVHNMNLVINNDDSVRSIMIPIGDGLTLVQCK